jgi:hypothetical protein
MRNLAAAAFRLALLTTLATTVVAVMIGRRGTPGEGPGRRTPRASRETSISKYIFAVPPQETPLFDPETGQTQNLALREGEQLDHASCSPWIDERRGAQMVGAWSGRSGYGADRLAEGFGLARFAFPSATLLDLISTSHVPASPPCWFPDQSTRILFPGTDGALYRHTFADSGAVHQQYDAEPTPLAWQVRNQNIGRVHTSDACWPIDPRFSRMLIVSLRRHSIRGGTLEDQTPKLWWLRLDRDRTAIEAAGPLSSREPEDAGQIERYPTVHTLPHGGLVLAYLRRQHGERDWSLCVAPLRFREDGSMARLDSGEVQTLSKGFLASPLAFSADCRWITGVQRSALSGPRVHRVPLSANLLHSDRPRPDTATRALERSVEDDATEATRSSEPARVKQSAKGRLRGGRRWSQPL